MIDGERELVTCPECDGEGYWDIGDVEDGVEELCPHCEGTGQVEYTDEEFLPGRDAFKVED